MIKNESLKQWMRIVSTHMPSLTIPQVRGLATWSFGMVMTRNSSTTEVAKFIASINDENSNTVECRLKEWYKEKSAKKGKKRKELDVTSCFGPLLKWVISLFPSDITHLPIVLNASNIKDKFTALTINVLYKGCAIPVAWKIVKGGEKGSYEPIWESLFMSLQGIVPPTIQVIVSADQNLYADGLYELIKEVGWHPFLQINPQESFCIPGESNWKPLTTVVPQVETRWAGEVLCFKTNPIQATLLARWDEGYQDPWLILTDFSGIQEPGEGYGIRSIIEFGYRDLNSDGWLWQNTRMTDPNRADRHWLAMAVATLGMVSLGIPPEGKAPPSSSKPLSSNPVEPVDSTQVKRPRSMSCFAQGLLSICLFPLIPDPLPVHPLTLPLNTC
ncbi:transposase [Oscillatoria acuminata]|nr:transposase [Oscillatoria acuminata]